MVWGYADGTPSATLFRECNAEMKEFLQVGIVMAGLVPAIHEFPARAKER
jgi:hypothetical protein